jgi:methyl-accepting chemotaxis protein
MLTYAILVIISTLVLIFSGIAIFTTVLSEASEAVLEDEDFGDILTSVIDTLSEVKYASEYAPEKLTDPEFMASLNAKKFYKGGMVVSYQGDYYNFSDLPKTMEFHEQLKATSHFDSEVMKRSEPDENDMKEHIVRYNDLSYFYIDFTFDAEGEDVTYFFIVDVSRTDSIGKSTGRRVLGTFVVIILLVTLPILVIVTTDIIQPIKKLEYGVKHIKNGDLNFKLKTRKNNEIGKVVRYLIL